MKKIIKIIFLSIIIFISYIILDFFIIKHDLNNEHIYIEKGKGYIWIYDKLGIKYSISDKIFFKLNKPNDLIEGKYEFSKKITKYDLINSFKKPIKEIVILTIPEGFTQKQIFERIEKLGLATSDEMLNALNSIKFPYKHAKDNFDGYLYPETYFFNKDSKPIDIAKALLGEFLRNFPEDEYNNEKFYDILKLASIVEFETYELEHKQEIAGVFKKRLKINMKLQSDATLKYELGRAAFRSELMNSNSLYNTYRHYGLPPTPICNPSKETILETIKAKESEYLYFFMSGNKTFYSKTHEEHLRKRRGIK